MANTPKIRFAGYTDDWEQRKLGELSSSFEYGLNAAAKEYDGENKYIRITDIDDESREFKQEDITSPDTDLSSAENYKLSEGDILFARTGASVGKSYIYKASDGLVYYAGFLIRARIKPEYNSEFVFQNTLTGDYEKFIKVTSMRSGQPGVNAQEYSQYQIMMPSKPEQDKISDCLRNLDNLITLHQRKLDSLKLCKKYMLSKMFPKDGETVPEIRFEGFTGDWKQSKFSDLVLIERGGSPRPINAFITDNPNGLNWVKIGDAPEQGRYIKKTAEKIRAEGLSKTREVHPGDLILSNSMSFGKPYIMGIDGCIHDGWLLIRDTQKRFDLKFLCHMLGTDQMLDQYRAFAAGSTVNNLNKELVGNTTVTIPSLKEQQVLGQYFENLDNLITLHQHKIDTLKQVKKFMLKNMFPGKA